MSLSPGTRIGSYDVIGPIGSGGMGDVYRARDTRLGRDVAIKVLPPGAGLDTDRIRRFEREAQILAALNHPHIAAIYGVEEAAAAAGAAERSRILILELVAGGTLADRLARGTLPIGEALPMARQLADALQAAHEHGIIHRDLKPANVALTRDGHVKVLDFGIAKITSPRDDDVTVTRELTEQGAVIGTVAYMSPEQARGLPVDKRTDIWSFGCVLFEALTGRTPFQSPTTTDTLAAILNREPDFSTLPPDTPPRIVWLLRRCLEKDLRRRLHDVADARIELDEALARPDDRSPLLPASSARRINRRELLAWIAAVAGVAAALIAINLSGRMPGPAETASLVQSAIVLPPGLRISVSEDPSSRFAISPDGRRLAIVATEGAGEAQLYVRAMDAQVPQPLAGTEKASHPFWSADGRSIAFLTRGDSDLVQTRLKRIDLATGQITTLTNVSVSAGGTWSEDGVILFTPAGNAPIHRIAASGGSPSPVTALDATRGDVQHTSPFFLPDGRHFLFGIIGRRAGSATAPQGLFLGSLDGNARPTLLMDNVTSAKFANGHLLFVRDGRLMAVPFDLDRLRPVGEPVQLAEGIQGLGSAGAALSVSTNGIIAYQAVAPVRMQLTWFARDGRPLSLLGGEADSADLALSRDGSRAAMSLLDPSSGTRDIWVVDVKRGVRERVTSGPEDDIAPVWSPTGDRLAFSSARQGGVELFVVPSDGRGAASSLATPGLDVGRFAATWSVDDRLVFIAGHRVLARSDLWEVDANGGGAPSPIAQSPAIETQARFSPDGRWLAYVTNEKSAGLEVYVQPFPGPGRRQRVSLDGGRYPHWSHDSSEIFFLAPDDRLMSTPIRFDGSEAHVGSARPLFKIQFRRLRLDAYPYDVSPDGRFLVNTLVEETTPAALSLLVNWPAAIGR